MIYSSADWQAIHDLPEGAVLIDDHGTAWQLTRTDGAETWLSPVSDEYAFIVRRNATPNSRSWTTGNLELVWKPK